MKLDKEKIKQIALRRFHDKHHESVYDCFTDALEVYLGEEGLQITKIPVVIKVPDENLGGNHPAERKID